MGEKQIFNPKDAIQANQGKVFVILDGQRKHWMNVKQIKVSENIKNGEIKRLGAMRTQHRPVSSSVEGSMTVYWVDSTVQDMVLKFAEQGVTTFFDVQGVHEDPSSNSGKNTYLFTDCVWDGEIPLFESDSDGEFLEQELNFLPNGVQKLSGFQNSTSIIAG